jgi:hypothetical protein
MRLRQIGSLAVMVILAVMVGFLIYAGQFSGVHRSGSATKGDMSFVLLSIWVASPYIGAFLVMRRIREWRVAERIASAAILLICAFGPALVVATVMRFGGAQGGLGFLYLPFLQWIAVGATAVVLAMVSQRRPA